MWLFIGAVIGVAEAAEPEIGTITSLLGDLTQQTGNTVLVGVAGPEAAKALEKLQSEHGDLAIKVITVPTLGDAEAEMSRALGAAALTCGVRVMLDPTDNSWGMTTHGACDEAEEKPRVAVGGLSYEQKVAALASYRAKALERERPDTRITTNPMVTGNASTSIPWQVVDGSGNVLTTRAFAESLKDQSTLDELAADARAARKRRTILSVLGPLAIAGGAGLALGAQPFDLTVSPVGSAAHKGQAFTQDFLTVGASALIAGGLGSLGLGLVQVPLADQKAAKVHKYYSSSEADKRIETHNGDALFSLGLSTSDLRNPPVPPAPPVTSVGGTSAPAAPAADPATPAATPATTTPPAP